MIRKQYAAAVEFYKTRLHKRAMGCLIAYLAMTVLVFILIMYVAPGEIIAAILDWMQRVVNGDATASSAAETITGSSDSWLYYVLHNGPATLRTAGLGIVPFLPIAAIILAMNGFAMGVTLAFNAFGSMY